MLQDVGIIIINNSSHINDRNKDSKELKKSRDCSNTGGSKASDADMKIIFLIK